MEPDQGDKDPARGRAESKAAEVEAVAAAPEQVRTAIVFVQAAASKRRTNWELPVLI